MHCLDSSFVFDFDSGKENLYFLIEVEDLELLDHDPRGSFCSFKLHYFSIVPFWYGLCQVRWAITVFAFVKTHLR